MFALVPVHCFSITFFNTLAFIKRNVQTNNQKVKETAYKTYVRPQLEYCAPIWHSWQDKLSYKVERVQRAAARYVLINYNFTSSVTDMLKILNWQILENRRIHNSLIILYKAKYEILCIYVKLVLISDTYCIIILLTSNATTQKRNKLTRGTSLDRVDSELV